MWVAAFVRTQSPWTTSCVVTSVMRFEATLSWSENSLSSIGSFEVPSMKVEGVGGILLDLKLTTTSGVTTVLVGMEVRMETVAIEDKPMMGAVGSSFGLQVDKGPVSLWI
jgi:hypothetical protein